ncbi:MAG: phospholipase D-like domain-containing protein [Candidatus Omnitrophota bacterium]|nr:phospholipase D-like domain-containing protein [Candidatus Omnitrophota bacterium]
MKRYLAVFIISLAVLGITARAYCYQAEAIDINGTKYFPAVKEALAKAKESINLVMFVIELSQYREDSEINQLVNGLIEAKQRGVDVEVILDQNVDFVQRRHTSDWEAKIRSIRAYKRLRDAGIRVYYDEPVRYTHAKAIVIDKSVVVLGSTNWTESSFNKSNEVNVLIDSKGLAEDILSYFKTIKIDSEIEKYLDFIGPSTPISWEFMENPKLAPLMIKAQDARAFDIYLYLLWKFSEKQGDSPQKAGTVPVLLLSYDDLAKHLGIYEGWTTTDYRRQIIKVLRRLEQKYKLIKFEPHYAKEAEVTLIEKPGDASIFPELSTRKIETSPIFTARNGTEGYFELPNDYFDFGWNKILFLRAKFCYFINLAYSSISDTKPYWSRSVAAITEQFGGIGEGIVYKGMAELRREKLIDVKYDSLTDKPYEKRMPKMYKILRLYNPKELELKLKEIEGKYGKEAYAQARKYAGIVFEENNPEVIEDIILKSKQYGEKKVKKAFGIAAQKNPDNPKRIYSYVVGIIENLNSLSQ